MTGRAGVPGQRNGVKDDMKRDTTVQAYSGGM